MNGYRQTPPCLVEQGKVNTALESVEYNKNWGATVSGETVIRRRGGSGPRSRAATWSCRRRSAR